VKTHHYEYIKYTEIVKTNQEINMPFYDLLCPKCKKEHKISASVKDRTENRIECPDCGGVDLETVYKTGPAYIKGAGTECPGRSSGCPGSCGMGR